MLRALLRLSCQRGAASSFRGVASSNRADPYLYNHEEEFNYRSPRNSHMSVSGNRSRAHYAGGRQLRLRSNDYGAGSKLRAVDWNRVKKHEIKKDFYNEHPSVSQRSSEEVEEWLAKREVTLHGENIPRPVVNFNEAGFPAPIEEILHKHYSEPTTIQSISWPVAMCGRDMISIARTGTGKTLGFALPGIFHILEQEQRVHSDGPIALVLAPTRELAQQVESVIGEYCRQMNIKSTCLFGGASKLHQEIALQRGVDFCIATPGRLLDMIQDGSTNLQRCSYLVLDEADRMLDMGFEPQIRKVVEQIRPDRQTLMFSATWPTEIRSLANDFQANPVFLNVGSMELSANHNIEQHVDVLEEHEKSAKLCQLLEEIGNQPENKTLIFVQTKHKADSLCYEVRKMGKMALAIHGDKSQSERDRVMREFRTGRVPILLATDVASRGIDVTDIRYVINYDYPNGSEDYVHRIGRTGRCDMKGTSYTFFTWDDAAKAPGLIDVLKEAGQKVPDELSSMVRRARGGGGQGGNSSNYLRGYNKSKQSSHRRFPY